jgi:hypothetical protein
VPRAVRESAGEHTWKIPGGRSKQAVACRSCEDAARRRRSKQAGACGSCASAHAMIQRGGDGAIRRPRAGAALSARGCGVDGAMRRARAGAALCMRGCGTAAMEQWIRREAAGNY